MRLQPLFNTCYAPCAVNSEQSIRAVAPCMTCREYPIRRNRFFTELLTDSCLSAGFFSFGSLYCSLYLHYFVYKPDDFHFVTARGEISTKLASATVYLDQTLFHLSRTLDEHNGLSKRRRNHQVPKSPLSVGAKVGFSRGHFSFSLGTRCSTHGPPHYNLKPQR
jgi:hypothetical protein